MNQAPSAKYRCPKCSSTSLRVECRVECHLHQTDDNMETELVDNTDWYFDGDSFMTCDVCFYGSTADAFKP